MTRFGVLAIFAGFASFFVGRAFGVVELYVIGAGFLGSVIAAVLFLALRTPRVSGVRRVTPTTLTAGDLGRVELQLQHHGAMRSTRFSLRERVARAGGTDHSAELAVDPMARQSTATAGYQLPTAVRGVIELGPSTLELRDPLGLLRRNRTVVGIDRVTVAPRAFPLEMPALGSGPLGRHLLDQARRLGPGEFHSLREYADGDEPRSIHWRASARTDKLLVKQHAVEGIRRALIVLDVDPSGYADAASFERAITAAASLVTSAHQAQLITRFVAGGIDLRGPDVAAHTMDVLAQLQADGTRVVTLDRQPGEGVGMMIAVSGSGHGEAMRAVANVIDPTQTTVQVTTDVAVSGPLRAAARTEVEFLTTWNALIGRSSSKAGRP